MKSDEYWVERATKREVTYQRGSNRTIGEVRKAYEKAFDNIEAEIRKIERVAANMPGDQQEPYAARLQRFRQLQQSIDDEVKKLARFETGVTKSRYTAVMNDAYMRTMFDIQQGVGHGFSFAALPKDAIKETLISKWSGKNFSSRVWDNTHIVAKQSKEIIQSGMLSGTSTKKMVEQLLESVGGEELEKAKFKATRLVRTEVNYFANQGELASYKEADIERYKYIATLDRVTSKECRSLDNQVFYLGAENTFSVYLRGAIQTVTARGAIVGRNYPPMHPFCRSTTIAVIDGRVEKELKRRARDPDTGKTYLVPADMSYREWQSVYVHKSLTNPKTGDTIGLKDINTLQGLGLFAKEAWSVKTVDITGLDAGAIKGTFETMDKAINDNPALKGSIKSISGRDMNGIMSTNFSGDVSFNKNNYAFGKLDDLKAEYAKGVASGFYPKGTTWESAGVHELGHRLNAEAIKKQYGVTSAMINDWNNNKTAKKVVDTAIKELKKEYNLKGFKRDELIYTISRYSLTDDGEVIAEAFSDVISNGANANVISARIIDILKRMI